MHLEERQSINQSVNQRTDETTDMTVIDDRTDRMRDTERVRGTDKLHVTAAVLSVVCERDEPVLSTAPSVQVSWVSKQK